MMKLIKRADHQEDYVRQWYKRQKREPPQDWGKEVKRKDENHRFEYLTDKDFNDNARGCYMVDGVYIGPYDIGINCCSMKDHDNKTFLVTLDEVKKALYPNLKGPILFMINKFFITHDEDLYRIDRNFIMKVELLNSSDTLR